MCLFGTASAANGTEYEFRIPAADASTGLNLFAKQSNTPLLFLNERVRDRRTNRVNGVYTVEQALELLLRDTGIEGSINRNGVLTVSTTDSNDETTDTGGGNMKRKQGFFAKLATLLVAVSGLNAQPAAAQGGKVLEEVVVTAQKREESLQDVGIAITALGEDRLVDAQVNNIQDLQNMAAGLTLGESFGFAQIMIRGVGTDNPFAGGDPSVAMHVDGVVTGRSSAQLGSLFDIQRIEVLRGPQGTLYGRNTTGGSINVITNKPTEEFSGYGRFTAGNYELLQFEGAVSGPLTEQLRGRIATKIVERGGYGENLANGDDIHDASQQSVRGHLEWLPTTDLDVRLTMEYHREDDRNYMPLYRDGSYLPNPPVPALAPQPPGFPRASDPRDIYADVPLQNEREQYSFTGEVNWRINDAFRLTSITNYQYFEKIPHQDFDMTADNFYVHSEQINSDQYSQELQLHYEGDRINGLVGAYYYNEEIESDNRLYQRIPVPPCGPATSTVLDYDIDDLCFNFRGAVNAEAAALFANFNFEFTDSVTINLGGRYSYETRKGFTDRWFAPGMFDPSTFDPVTGTFDPAPITFADEGSFSDFTPRVGIEWNATDDLLIYGTYSEGFKSGILLSGQTTPLLEPETVEALEVGMKGQFFRNRLQVNAAAFFYDYSDLQLGRAVPAGATGFTLVYENAAQAEVEGFELEASWLVTDQFRIDGSVTYLDAEFVDYVTTDPFDTVFFQLGLAPPPPGEQLAGNRLIQAPEWAGTLRGIYDFALPYDGWTGQAALEAAFKDQVYFTQFNYDALGQDDVITLNANMKFTSSDGTWMLNLWGKNLTDEDIYTGTFIINGSRTNAGMLKPPRTFGATLGYNF